MMKKRTLNLRGGKAFWVAVTVIFAGCGEPSVPSLNRLNDACYRSCQAQLEGCVSLDLTRCYGLCECVNSTFSENKACVQLALGYYACDLEFDWQCSDEFTMVGKRNSPPSPQCAERIQAFHDAQCVSPCASEPDATASDSSDTPSEQGLPFSR